MIRSGTGFYIYYNAYNVATNKLYAGDVDNHTLKLVSDGILTDPLNSPEEIAAGSYRIFIEALENIGVKSFCLGGISSTQDIVIVPRLVITDLLLPGSSFVAYYTAWNNALNLPKTGDTGNHTITISNDSVSGAATNAPSEISAVSLPGISKITLTDAEGTGRSITVLGSSSTDDTNIISTEYILIDIDYPAEANVKEGIDYAEGTLTGTLESGLLLPLEVVDITEEIETVIIDD